MLHIKMCQYEFSVRRYRHVLVLVQIRKQLWCKYKIHLHTPIMCLHGAHLTSCSRHIAVYKHYYCCATFYSENSRQNSIIFAFHRAASCRCGSTRFLGSFCCQLSWFTVKSPHLLLIHWFVAVCFSFLSSLWLSGGEDGVLLRDNVSQISVCYWWILQDEERGMSHWHSAAMTSCCFDFVSGSLADIISYGMCMSEGGRERGKPPVGRSRAILWPAAVSGRWRRGDHHEQPVGGGPRSTWCDLPDWKWKSSPSEHHHSPCDRHGNLTIQSNGRFHVCLFVREGTPSCFTKHHLVCVQHSFRWAVLLYCGQMARTVVVDWPQCLLHVHLQQRTSW